MATPGHVTIEIFNIRGQRVNTLFNESVDAGSHRVVWAGLDNNNQHVGSGVFFYRMTAGGYTSMRRMVLLK
jgi:flagellar hook assembly protein FlgD